MAKPEIVLKIEAIDQQLKTLDESGTITHGAYVMLTAHLTTLKTKYAAAHGDDIRKIAKLEARENQIPVLLQASNILLHLRTALPTDGSVDMSSAEEAIVATIAAVADQLKEVLNTSK